MIEVRYMTTTNCNGRGSRVCLDEIVARNASIHLEDLGTSWMLIVAKDRAVAHFNLPKGEAKRFDAVLTEEDGCRVTVDGKEKA